MCGAKSGLTRYTGEAGKSLQWRLRRGDAYFDFSYINYW